MKSYRANNKEEAWKIVDKLFPTDYTKDEGASVRAGYPIYRSPINYYHYICDLNTRLEINLSSEIDSCSKGTINIWIEDPVEEARKELARITKELYPN